MSSHPEAPEIPHAAAPSRHGFGATDVMLLAMAAIWGINFSVMKYGVTALTPTGFNALRVSLATVALTAVAFAPGTHRPSPADARRLMALGLLGHAAYQMFFANGLNHSRAGTAALVIAASPAFIAILGRVLGVERVTPRAAAGIVLSVAGVGCVVFGAAAESVGDDSVLGIALILCGSLSWAFYTHGLRPITHRVDGIQIATWTLYGGALPLILAGVPSLLTTDLAAVSPRAWGAVAYSGLGAYVLAYVFWYRGVQAIGPTRTSMYANIQPIIALIFAWVALGELPTAWQFVGAACVITGLYLARK